MSSVISYSYIQMYFKISLLYSAQLYKLQIFCTVIAEFIFRDTGTRSVMMAIFQANLA